MTATLIIEDETNEAGRFFELANEKRAVQISVCSSFTTVCVKNASHRVWQGMGRVFHGSNTLQQAADSYKDPNVKSLIHAAADLLRTENN